VLVAKLDTDAHPQIAATMGIRGIPTLILFSGGSEVGRQTGAVPRSIIDSMLEDPS
jgi:thioredoxin-like negative regulator of GroEL